MIFPRSVLHLFDIYYEIERRDTPNLNVSLFKLSFELYTPLISGYNDFKQFFSCYKYC